MKKQSSSVFDNALWAVSSPLKTKLLNLPDEIKKTTYEIRLRANRPVILYGKYKSMFFTVESTLSKEVDSTTYFLSPQEVTDTFNRVCGYSIHTYQQDINNGFVTVKGGHRVGIAGTAVCDSKGDIVSIKDVTSLNIRIARSVDSCSDEIVNSLLLGSDKSIIIAGPPSSGKTTVLKDLSKSLSCGRFTEMKKVVLIDERHELSSGAGEILSNDVGFNCDVLCSFPKDRAIMTAMRTLSPEYIICDEVGNEKDVEAIKQGVNSGIFFIVSVHAYDIEDLLNRVQTQGLLETFCFDNVVMLSCEDKPCTVREIYDAKELVYEIYNRRAGIGSDDIYGA